jgi:hypothetical protein
MKALSIKDFKNYAKDKFFYTMPEAFFADEKPAYRREISIAIQTSPIHV